MFTMRAQLPLAAIALCTFSVSPALAATIRVPDDYATIQLAIDNAMEDDVVLVAPDTYETELSIPVSITLRSEDGPGTTVLTGMGTHRVIDSVTADLVLEGFTIERGGDGNAVAANSFFGGGMRVEAATSSITIENCVFRLNKAGQGAGVYCKGSLAMSNTTVVDNGNGQEFPTAALGGGVWCNNVVSVDACTFRANRSAFGAGLLINGLATIRNSVFDDNYCNGIGGGIGMSQTDHAVVIEGCEFVNNFATHGGGAFINSTIQSDVRACSFTDNRGGLGGGALYVQGDGPHHLEDSTFQGNTMGGARGGGAIVLFLLRGGATVERCYFRDNRTLNPSGSVGGGAVWMNEMANAIPPRFFDCTFVENAAPLGSAVLISSNGVGPNRPLFERCLFGLNIGDKPIACGRPGFDPSSYLIICSVLADNDVNEVCGVSGSDVFIVEQDETLQIFCDDNFDSICTDSVAHAVECGPVGGLPTCGTCLVPTESMSWSTVKSRFSR